MRAQGGERPEKIPSPPTRAATSGVLKGGLGLSVRKSVRRPLWSRAPIFLKYGHGGFQRNTLSPNDVMELKVS